MLWEFRLSVGGRVRPMSFAKTQVNDKFFRRKGEGHHSLP